MRGTFWCSLASPQCVKLRVDMVVLINCTYFRRRIFLPLQWNFIAHGWNSKPFRNRKLVYRNYWRNKFDFFKVHEFKISHLVSTSSGKVAPKFTIKSNFLSRRHNWWCLYTETSRTTSQPTNPIYLKHVYFNSLNDLCFAYENSILMVDISPLAEVQQQ